MTSPLPRDEILGLVTQGDGVWELDLRTGAVKVDPASWRMLGYDPDAPALPPWPSLAHPDDRSVVWTAGNAAMTRGQRVAFTIRQRGADGAFRRVVGRGLVTGWAPDGAPIALSGTHAVVETHGDLRAGAARDALLDAVPDVLLVLNSDGTVVAVHAGAERATRAAADGLVGTRLGLALPPDSGRRLEEQLAAALRTGTLQVCELDWPHDGRPHRFDLRLARITTSTALGLLQDVTERTATSALLERISAAVPGGVYLYSLWPDGHDAFLYLNAQVERLLGVPAERIWANARTASTNVVPEDVTALREAIDRSHREGSTFDHPFRVRHEGEVRWLRAQAVPSRPEPDGAVTWAGVLLDATQERQAEDERRRLADRAARSERLEQLGLMAGGIAHDFNNLLVGVFGSAAHLVEELGPVHPAAQFAREIEEAARQMAEITRQMLHFSGRNPAPPRRLDLSRAVRDSLALVQASVGGGARLEPKLAAEGPDVVADAGQVTQVLANLVLNAADAIGSGQGTIWVETGVAPVSARELAEALWDARLAAGPHAYLEVRDDGPGMESRVRERMFEPFFSTKDAGRGLGLAVVAGIVRGCNGTVHVDSAPGRGTRIRVLLPLAEPGMEARPPGATPAPAAVRTTVLVVDDEPHVRSVAKRVLERAGHRVLVAEDGEMALTLARESPVQVALVDATMPGMSGADVLRALAELRPGLPLVLMSGYAREEVRDAAAGAAAGFVAKPFSPEELREAVRAALRPGGPDHPTG